MKVSPLRRWWSGGLAHNQMPTAHPKGEGGYAKLVGLARLGHEFLVISHM